MNNRRRNSTRPPRGSLWVLMVDTSKYGYEAVAAFGVKQELVDKVNAMCSVEDYHHDVESDSEEAWVPRLGSHLCRRVKIMEVPLGKLPSDWEALCNKGV